MEIPYEKTMVEIFRWRVEKSGEQIAHKFEDKETTFKELDSFSNRVAQGLIKEGCKPDSRVAYLGKNSDIFVNLCMEHSNQEQLQLELIGD